jgi:hypothetical protein
MLWAAYAGLETTSALRHILIGWMADARITALTGTVIAPTNEQAIVRWLQGLPNNDNYHQS